MASGLEYAIHRVIREYANAGENRLGIVKTYKTIFDVYRQLKEGTPRIDLALSWSWYTHGPVMQYRYVSTDALRVGEPERRNDGEAPYRAVSTGELDYTNLPEPTRNRIDEVVTRVVPEYADMSAAEVTNSVYQRYAPHSFERSFRKLARGFQAEDLDYEDKDLKLLDQVQREFPYSEFPDVVPTFVDWSAFMRLAIERYPKFLWDYPKIVKGFQSTYGHRMELDYNEHVEPLLPVWRQNFEASLGLLRSDLAEKRWEIDSLLDRPKQGALNAYRETVLEDLQQRAGLA